MECHFDDRISYKADAQEEGETVSLKIFPVLIAGINLCMWDRICSKELFAGIMKETIIVL